VSRLAPLARVAAVRRNTRLLTLAQGLAQAASPVVLIVGSQAIVDLTGRDASVGLLNGSYFVAAALGAFALGRLMDRAGRRPGFLLAYVSIGVSGVGAWAAISAGSSVSLLVAGVGFGLGFGGANLARAAVADMHPPEHRGLAVGYVLATAVISDITAPHERGGALGFNDLLVAASSATAGFVGGFVFDAAGFRVLASGVAALVLLVVLLALRMREGAVAPVREG
jgi:MFS family permease